MYVHRSVIAVEWDVNSSNQSLTFSNGNSTVERVGSVSCYPAVFAVLPSDRCAITVRLDDCPLGTNWLTFGIARSITV